MLMYFFSFLFLIISLINSHLLNIFWVDFWFYVNWNYEFTKSIFFIWISSIIFIFFILKNFKNKIFIPKNFIFIYLIFFISIISSDFFLTNIFWNNQKWHWILLYTNLSFLYLLLLNTKKENIKKIINFAIYLSIIPLIIVIKEYFFPTFDYWNLSNRAFGTFGHPNYLALYIITIIPFVLAKIKEKKYLFLFLLLTIVLFLTKSLFGISIFIFYLIYFLTKKYNFNKKYLSIIIFLLIGITFIIIYKFWFLIKLNSFVSRFYIWVTTLNILISNPKYLLFWVWCDSLSYLFDSFKSPLLYIYENIWYAADRPHNLILQIIYNFWLLWLIFFIIFIKKIFKYFKNTPEYHSIIIFLIFTFLNFASIINYIFLIFLLAYISKNKIIKKKNYLLKFLIIIISTISCLLSFLYYKEEHNKYINENYTSKYNFYNNIYLENPEYKIFNQDFSPITLCERLTNKISSAENFFYCGDILWDLDKELSEKYYKKWLKIIPDMRNKKSLYYNNIITRTLFNKKRFFSEKFSNLQIILKKNIQ